MRFGPEILGYVDGIQLGCVYVRQETDNTGKITLTGIWNKQSGIFDPIPSTPDIDKHVHLYSRASEDQASWLWRFQGWAPDLDLMTKPGVVSLTVRVNNNVVTEIVDSWGKPHILMLTGVVPV
jgi:hypothetical protein